MPHHADTYTVRHNFESSERMFYYTGHGLFIYIEDVRKTRRRNQGPEFVILCSLCSVSDQISSKMAQIDPNWPQICGFRGQKRGKTALIQKNMEGYLLGAMKGANSDLNLGLAR